MTVHKSQGSEFDHTALVLPNHYLPVLTRELVYTAITRARRQLTLYTDRQIFARAVAVRTLRRSGLVELKRAAQGDLSDRRVACFCVYPYKSPANAGLLFSVARYVRSAISTFERRW